MLIEYVANKSRREVPDLIGETLIKRKIACHVHQTRQIEHEEAGGMTSVVDEEISPRTGKPKRKYERRDMKAKD